jgi:hypothetical protein
MIATRNRTYSILALSSVCLQVRVPLSRPVLSTRFSDCSPLSPIPFNNSLPFSLLPSLSSLDPSPSYFPFPTGLSRDILPFKSSLALPGAYFACVMIMIIAIFSGWTVFLDGKWDTAQFLTNYIPLGLFPLLFVIKKLYSKTSWRKASEMDFFTNIPEIEADCYDEPEPTTWYGKVGAAVF